MENKDCVMQKLEFENKELRKCVEFYAVNGLANVEYKAKMDHRLAKRFYIGGEYARQVLLQLDNFKQELLIGDEKDE